MHGRPAGFDVHAVAALIHAQAHTAPDLLTFLSRAVGVLERTNLKHIRIVPALTKSGMGKDEPRRLVEGKQTLFVFQNQIIGGDIVGELRATLGRAVDGMPGLFINAEIALVRVGNINTAQILLIRRIEKRDVLIEYADILLLKHFSVFAE